MPKRARYLLIFQGAYFVITGLWAIADIKSFMHVTGPKTDLWLVKTLSLVFIIIGLTFLIGAFENKSNAIKLLSVLSALALIIVDLYYTGKGVIRMVYLGDAFMQFLFVLLWLFAGRKHITTS